jgi:hypothetical protein
MYEVAEGADSNRGFVEEMVPLILLSILGLVGWFALSLWWKALVTDHSP